MTVLRTSNAPIGLDRGKPITTENSLGWVAPSDWITYTVPTASEQKIIGTVAVFNQDSNYFAVNMTTTDGSQYTVDWGDGTSANFASGTTAEKNYSWSSISSGTLTSEGYRQAIVTITPTISGRTFSIVQTNRRHSALTSSNLYPSPWLSLSIAAPNATSITLSGNTSTSVNLSYAQQVQIISSNITSAASLFTNCYYLQDVVFNTSATLTNTSSMFANCRNLQVAPFFNTASVTTMSGMFSTCRLLKFVPLYNTASVTSMSAMFDSCSSLKTVPLFNTAAVTNMSSMFSTCASLESVPLFNTASVTTMGNMFFNSNSLKSIPLFNTASVTNMSNMLYQVNNLETIPAFNTASVTTMDGMFRFTSGLVFLPGLNTANATTVANMFTSGSNGTLLREITELNLSGVTSLANNNLGLGNTSATSNGQLTRAKITGNKWTQSFQNCSMGATELNEMYTSLATLNPAITNVSGNGTTVTVTVGTANISPFVAGRSVTITGVTPVAYNISGTIASVNTGAGTFTITNAATGTYVSGGTATVTSDVTITVTGNPGVATDNPAIATAKGWTVTG
jgi:surface protein